MATNNQTALITGATSGIGYELAKLFAQDGFRLVIVSRNEATSQQVAEEFKQLGSPQVTTITKDLTQLGAAEEVYQETKRQGITVNILVNDAGVGEYGFFHEIDFSKDLEIIQLNIITFVHLTKLYLRDMLAANEGRILQLASIASHQPTPRLAVYAASKAFVLSLTDALIHELKDTNVTMTALLPGATDTDFFRKANMEHTKAAQEDPYDPAMVAKKGYDALMKGEHHAVAGAMMKAQVILSNMLPNELVSSMAENYMLPADQ